MTNFVISVGIGPSGQTPDYLDPQSEETLHEVDVNGMAPHISFCQHQRVKPSGVWEQGTGLDRWVTE